MKRKYTEEELRLAIEAAREFDYIEDHKFHDFTPDLIIANINNLQDAMGDENWIRVQDQLPERSVAVLTFTPQSTHWNALCIQDIVDSKGKRIALDVTHWQYLPEYPEGLSKLGVNIPSNS